MYISVIFLYYYYLRSMLFVPGKRNHLMSPKLCKTSKVMSYIFLNLMKYIFFNLNTGFLKHAGSTLTISDNPITEENSLLELPFQYL